MEVACILCGGYACGDASEIVAIADGDCMHLFVVVRVDYYDGIVCLLLLLMVAACICLWWLKLLIVMIVRLLQLLMEVACVSCGGSSVV